MTYGTLAGFRAYHTARGTSAPTSATDDACNHALLRASVWLDGRFRGRFAGVRTGGRDQVREWPRKPITANQAYNRQDAWGAPKVPYGYKGLPYPATVFDLDGNEIPTTVVPVEIEYATYEAALRELATPGGLSPDYVYSGRVTSERIGPMGVTYAGPMNGADDVRPVVTIIEDILAPLIQTKMQFLSGPTGRA